MTTALIADDEPHLARYLKERLALLWPELNVVAVAKNGVEAAAMIEEHAPQVAFLDIKMPGMTGLEVAQGIESQTRVVFVTAYDEFAVTAFEADAVDYVLKPVTDDRLTKTIERVRRALGATSNASPTSADQPAEEAMARVLQKLLAQGQGQPTNNPVSAAPTPNFMRHIRASRGDITYQIDVADVLYFDADDKYTVVMTDQGEHLIRAAISELARELDPAVFWQIHRSTVININKVHSTRRDEVSKLFVRFKDANAKGGVHTRELPVSRAYVHLFKTM